MLCGGLQRQEFGLAAPVLALQRGGPAAPGCDAAAVSAARIAALLLGAVWWFFNIYTGRSQLLLAFCM